MGLHLRLQSPEIVVLNMSPILAQVRRDAVGARGLGELVADTPDREHELGAARVVLDLRPQTVDVRVDSVLVAAMTVAPDMVQELGA